MNQLVRVLTVLSTLGMLVGCGAAAPSRASIPQHRWSEGDWYADALEEAVDAYEAEVELSASRMYDSEAEADAVARNHGEARFQQHVTRELHQRGLTRRGLRVYTRHHPEFIDRERAHIAPRMAEIRETVATIATRVDPDLRPLVAFEGEDRDTRVASRD